MGPITPRAAPPIKKYLRPKISVSLKASQHWMALSSRGNSLSDQGQTNRKHKGVDQGHPNNWTWPISPLMVSTIGAMIAKPPVLAIKLIPTARKVLRKRGL